jgi:hypothetical protein
MEPTITQNRALYLAHQKVSKRRAALFRRLRIAARKQSPDVRRQLISGTYLAYCIRTTGAEGHRNSNSYYVMIAKKTPPSEGILLQG